jgi:hypothetical protein
MTRYAAAVLEALPLAAVEWELLHRRCTDPLHDVLAVRCYHDGDEPPSALCPGCGADRPALRVVIEIVPDRPNPDAR